MAPTKTLKRGAKVAEALAQEIVHDIVKRKLPRARCCRPRRR
ncbi:hypothetical protein [Streptomyces sp. RTd22]|nr:hypothetical protein [Streptomyces sp. RTd22]